MATDLEEPTSRIDNFTDYYETITTKMLGETGSQKKAIDLIQSTFENLELTSEDKGKILAEIAVQTTVQFNKDAKDAALELIKMEPDFELKQAQRDFAIRQIQGYDDNLLLKIVEEQGGLASFAVNAGSDSAQTTINDLKTKMASVEARVKPLNNETVVIATPITSVPTNFVATTITDTTISLSWTAVTSATSYLVYKDGVLASTSGNVTYNDTGLTADTKYAYTVKASIDGIKSDHTNALVIKTSA